MTANKLRNFLRMSFVTRKGGLAWRRNFIMDMDVMLKRGRLLRKSLTGLMLRHNSRRGVLRSGTLAEYELSFCSSAKPVFPHTKRRHSYFPCVDATHTFDEPDAPLEKQSTVLSPFSIRMSTCSLEVEEGEVDVDAERFINNFYEQFRAQSCIALLECQVTDGNTATI